MPKRRRRQGPRPGRLIQNWLAQPVALFYGQANLYWCGREMEIENFLRIQDFGEGYLKLVLAQGVLTVYGDELTIASLEKGRILLRGRFLKAEFSYE